MASSDSVWRVVQQGVVRNRRVLLVGPPFVSLDPGGTRIQVLTSWQRQFPRSRFASGRIASLSILCFIVLSGMPR